MACVAPLLVLLLLGIFEAARLGMVCQLLTTAAREGCRVAVIANSTQADVQARVNAVLAGSGIDPGTVTPTCTGPLPWTSAPKGTPITVIVSVHYSDVTWTPNSWFNPLISGSATLSCERP
jgi:Flp pilus assembly protein TadG